MTLKVGRKERQEEDSKYHIFCSKMGEGRGSHQRALSERLRKSIVL